MLFTSAKPKILVAKTDQKDVNMSRYVSDRYSDHP